MSGRPRQLPQLPAAKSVAALAEQAGFTLRWDNAQGQAQEVDESVLAGLLERLGLPCGDTASLEASAAMLAEESAGRHLPPMMTAQAGAALCLPASAVGAGSTTARYRIELEGGSEVAPALEGEAVAEGATIRLPPIDRCGYHTLSIGAQQVRLAIAPARCFSVADALASHEAPGGANGGEGASVGLDGARQRLEAATLAAMPAPETGLPAARAWGIGVQVYGLRRSGDDGLGDYTALAEFAECASHQGAASLAMSPVHAMFSADVSKFSPYSPSSRLFLNVLHIDAAETFGSAVCQAAHVALSPALRALAETARAAPLVDWPAAAHYKLALLRQLFQSLSQARPDAALQGAFENYTRERGRALEDHARFEALHAYYRQTQPECSDWRRWAVEHRDPGGAGVEAFAAAHRQEVDFHLFLQWLAERGLASAQRRARDAGMPIGLIADLAVGCDGGGSDAWRARADMLRGISVGAPPDLFNQSGQSWGLTTFSPRAMVQKGFGAFIDMLRATMRHAGGLRIDHILGLQRLWLVPEGGSARDGAYLRYPFDDLLRLVTLESWRQRCIIIGEDLGTVPAGFRDRMHEKGLLGMSVLWFTRDAPGASEASRQGPSAVSEPTLADQASVAAAVDGAASERDASQLGAAAGAVDDGEDAGLPADSASLSADRSRTAATVANDDAARNDHPAELAPSPPDTGRVSDLGVTVAGFTAPARWSSEALAMTTTHDLPTIVGWWQGRDIEWRARIWPAADGKAGLAREKGQRAHERETLWQALGAARLVDATRPAPEAAPAAPILAFVAETPAPLAIFPIEDLVGDAEQPNLPGSIDEHPNWRRRQSGPAERLFSDAGVRARLALIDSQRKAGQAPAPASRGASSASATVAPASESASQLGSQPDSQLDSQAASQPDPQLDPQPDQQRKTP